MLNDLSHKSLDTALSVCIIMLHAYLTQTFHCLHIFLPLLQLFVTFRNHQVNVLPCGINTLTYSQLIETLKQLQHIIGVYFISIYRKRMLIHHAPPPVIIK